MRKKSFPSALNLLPPAAAFIITFVVFLPALKNGFVNWDDYANLRDNLNFRGLSWQNIKWAFTTFHMGPYQPFSWLSYSLDYKIWGLNPFGYHLTNIFIHSLNAVFFYFLAL